jgi:hypothetical protein
MEEKVQYGVQTGPDGEVMVVGHEPGAREHAITVASRLNERGGSYMAVQRTITVTDWAPFNTGIVPPSMQERE